MTVRPGPPNWMLPVSVTRAAIPGLRSMLHSSLIPTALTRPAMTIASTVWNTKVAFSKQNLDQTYPIE
jgi:hypothetical protein